MNCFESLQSFNWCFILCLFLLFFTTQSWIAGETYQIERDYGILSDWITSRPDMGDFPSQYFLCGIALRESLWTMWQYNCDCGPRFSRWRFAYECSWCPNNYWTQVNSIKAVFCSSTNWNMQINRYFDTGNKNYRDWREVMCPYGQYASKITGKTGSEFGFDTGFVGLQIKCENLNFTESTIVQDNYTHKAGELSKNKQGTFVSALRVKYLDTANQEKIVGMRWNFQSVVNISKITTKYGSCDNNSSKSTVIETTSIENLTPIIIQKTVTFTKPYTIINKWTNFLDFTSRYVISPGVRMSPMIWTQKNVSYSIYSQNSQSFQFGKEIQTIYRPNEQILVLVASEKVVNISSVIEEKKVNVAYEAVLEFIDQFEGSVVCERTVKGIWDGAMTSSVRTVVEERAATK